MSLHCSRMALAGGDQLPTRNTYLLETRLAVPSVPDRLKPVNSSVLAVAPSAGFSSTELLKSFAHLAVHVLFEENRSPCAKANFAMLSKLYPRAPPVCQVWQHLRLVKLLRQHLTQFVMRNQHVSKETKLSRLRSFRSRSECRSTRCGTDCNIRFWHPSCESRERRWGPNITHPNV